MAHDRLFFEELVTRCRDAGIPIRARPEEFLTMLYPLVLAALREDDLGGDRSLGSIDPLLELVAAFCLGEVELENPIGPTPDSEEEKSK